MVCSSCGHTFAEFQKVGLLGCPDCYRAFEHELGRVFKRLHGATHHAIDIAKISETLSDLYVQLDDAVQREAYEEAGEIRDRIKKLKAREDP